MPQAPHRRPERQPPTPEATARIWTGV